MPDYGLKMVGSEGRTYRVSRILVYAALIVAAVYYLLPFFIMIATSIKTMEDIRTGNLISLPRTLSFAAWSKAWGTACIGVNCVGLKAYFMNSVRMVIPSVALSTMIGALNGYVFAKWRFRGSEAFFFLLLLGCFIPFQVVILPMSRTLGSLGIAQSTVGLVLVHTIYGLPFTSLFFRNYFVAIPDEIVESAKIDGAAFFRIFGQIFLPIAGPIFVVAIIWQTTQIWNDFLFGVCFSGSDSQPITVALNNLVNTSTGVKEYNVDMSGAIIAAVPTLAVYIISGKYFVRGLTAGTIKG